MPTRKKNICCRCDQRHEHPFCFVKPLRQEGNRLCPGLFCNYISCPERDICAYFRDLSLFCIRSRAISFVMFYPFCLIKWFKTPLYLLNGAFFTASLLFFLFTINCGINYYRNSFSYEAGFVIRTHSTDELYALCSDLVNKVNENIPTEIGHLLQMPGISLIFRIFLICKNGKRRAESHERTGR